MGVDYTDCASSCGRGVWPAEARSSGADWLLTLIKGASINVYYISTLNIYIKKYNKIFIYISLYIYLLIA